MFQESDIGRGVEVLRLVSISKLTGIQRDGPKNFLSIALSAGRNFRLGVQGSPGLVKGGGLPE